MFKKIACALMLLPCFVFCEEIPVEKSISEMVWDDISIKGTSLLRRFWEDRQTGNSARASTYMDSHFQSVYYFGALDKSGELNVIENLHMEDFVLSKLVETRDGSLMILTYIAQVQETLNGEPVYDSYAPCVTIFKYVEGRWKLMSHTELSYRSFT